MRLPFTAASSAALLALALAPLAQAAPTAISNAAFAATYVRDCRSAAAQTAGSTTPDRCGVVLDSSGQPIFSRIIEQQSQLTLGGTMASATATNPIGAHGGKATTSSIDVSGAAGVLALKQGAFAGDYARTSGHSLGIQSFEYTGPGSVTRTVHNVLDFTANVAPTPILDNPGDTGLGTTAATVYAKTRVTVFSLSTASFDFDPDLGLEPQGSGFWSAASSRADFVLEGQINNDGITATGTATDITFTVTAGRYYFIESYLGLWARFGGELDATHTFTSTLGYQDVTNAFVADATGFVAAAEAPTPVVLNDNFGTVPEPASAALVGLALLAAGGVRRRGGQNPASSTALPRA
ncbi:PEP-CTERM sorting domain-containing protein [Roseateles puraquae]|uniref:PEP-CTERM sorting domain-containing protein n=1 Tax=Roseateles puraquae TaxID=431059 RepID=UPI0031E0FE98